MSQEDFLRAQLAQAEAALEATRRVKEMAEYHYRQILDALRQIATGLLAEEWNLMIRDRPDACQWPPDRLVAWILRTGQEKLNRLRIMAGSGPQMLERQEKEIQQLRAAIRSLARFHERDLRVRGVRQERPPVEALDGRELGRLMAALDGDDWISRRNRAMVALMARAGLRVGEVLALRPEDVELNARSGWVLVRRGKGMKERRVPLSAEARRALREYLEVRPRRSGPLFFSRTYQPLTGRDVQRLVAEAARRAGLGKRVTPHTLRHTFATRFLQAGGDLATLQAVLGHANLSTTARYLHPDAGRVQEMMEEL